MIEFLLCTCMRTHYAIVDFQHPSCSHASFTLTNSSSHELGVTIDRDETPLNYLII